jgi:pyruvate formate lyase activating enzyme
MVALTDADDIIRKIQKHRLFYSYSGGGITFSGGEATSQPEFLDYLSREIYDMGYSMDIETCGMFDFGRLAPVLARMDLIFMDLKMMDPGKHLKYTGVSNEKILENIANLAKLRQPRSAENEIDLPISKVVSDEEGRIGNDGKGPEIVIRIPVVGGVNDDEDNIRSSAAYVHRYLPHARMELLPYHRYGMVKYEALGIQYEHPDFSTPGKAEMERLRDIVRSEGVEVADFR